jgi:threonine aldolase
VTTVVTLPTQIEVRGWHHWAMSEVLVDLYSDTQTRPTAAMRAAMADAEVGDEQQRSDPTVTALCGEVAEVLGHEAAVFLPTGTMCNLVGVAAHVAPGDAVIMEHLGHVLRSETGGIGVVSGAVVDTVRGERGVFTAADLAPALAPGNAYRPPPTLVCLEQTHNFGGGTVWPLDTYTEVVELAHDHGLRVHLDGARLFNAVVASGVDAERWAGQVDSAWVDFTKGLGAPLGAVLAGPGDYVERAWRWKHRLGGAMRQAGIVAAACRYALAHHVDRLADDHARAQTLAAGFTGLGLAVEPVASNMVWTSPASVGLGAEAFAKGLRAAGVRVSTVGDRVRAVTHLDIDDGGIERAIAAAAATIG